MLDGRAVSSRLLPNKLQIDMHKAIAHPIGALVSFSFNTLTAMQA